MRSGATCGEAKLTSLASLLCWRHALSTPRRGFNVTQSGYDSQPPTPWHTLGFSKDPQLRMMQRAPEDLRLGLIREAKGLSPDDRPEDKAKLESLLDAYVYLTSKPHTATLYATHHDASNDSKLHILQDGGEHNAAFNPEHKAFDFSSKAGDGAARAFGDFTEAYRSASSIPSASVDGPADAKKTEPRRGQDVLFTLQLRFDEALYGCKKTIAYTRNVRCRHCDGCGTKSPASSADARCRRCNGVGKFVLPSGTYHIEKGCDHCSGSGKQPPPTCRTCRGSGVETCNKEHLTVTIAPGTVTGSTTSLHGKGNCGPRGGPSGHLVVELLVSEHQLFTRIGNDLHIAIPVPLSIALLGGVVTVPSLRGTTQLRVPAGIHNGQVLSIPDGGVPSADTSGMNGSMRVHCVVVIPSGQTLTGRQRGALEAVCADSNAQPSTSSPNSALEWKTTRQQVEASLKSKYTSVASRR